MKTTQRLKQEIFKEVLASGLFKQVQSKLKTEVLNLTDKESNQNKKQLGFQYEHPLLNKLRKYPLTSLCLDLIQQFLESFKFKYTLSVFKKEINRDINLERLPLANNFQIQMKNPQTQAVLLTLVSQLVSGDIKINPNKQTNAFNATNKIQNNPRVNNFIGNQNQKYSQQANGYNFDKKTPAGVQQSANNPINEKSKPNIPSSSNSIPQQQKSSNNLSNNQSSSQSSSIIDQSLKPQESKTTQVKQEAKIQETKDDKNKKGRKKKEIEKPPQGATDLMGELMSKFNTKDQKAQEQEKKKKLFEQKRVFSEQKAQKVLDPSESGANKIRGVSMGKMSSFLNKFMPQQAPAVKNESYIEQDLDDFQQSKDSTKKNPLFSSSESGFDKSGYYDVSVDSNAINDFEYVEKAKKITKK